MVNHSGKIFPRPTADTKRYWEGCKKHEVLIQYCSGCDKYQFYPRPICTNCMNEEIEWKKSTGRGKVLSYTSVHRAISKAYAKEAPYFVALIELDEGVTMMSNIISCKFEEIKIGMRVEVIFEDWSEEIAIPKFRPV